MLFFSAWLFLYRFVETFETNRYHWSSLSASDFALRDTTGQDSPNKKGASGIIKFLAGSCLSGLGIVLKEP
jgi:hypothetical protein